MPSSRKNKEHSLVSVPGNSIANFPAQTLKRLRAQIDRADAETIALFARRLRIARRLAHVKSRCGLPLVDVEREERMWGALRRLALRHCVDFRFVKNMFSLIFAATKEEMEAALQGDADRGERLG